ncbi:alpha/beta fold hydrolase [Solirhodobacter olei]|uniref:alpha/beta fold hydrolase n=1 Tax=Solirhodobacter olei TaxID=2493082 RepID=UPI000FD70C8B|nr:alpha/beta hydrolase [Solirhodobacter olei]
MNDAVTEEWGQRLRRCIGDAELRRLSPGLEITCAFVIGDTALTFAISEGSLNLSPTRCYAPSPQLTVRATPAAWERCLENPPPPAHHAFTAWELANPEFELEGDAALRAQARAALERIVEIALRPSDARPSAPFLPQEPGQITGKVKRIVGPDGDMEIYFESAGEGTPLVMLHTAGADSRQFRAQLADPELASRFRMIAPDLPFHGRSMPPYGWDGGPYKLDGRTCLAWCKALLSGLAGAPAVVMGGSMGAAITLRLAVDAPEMLLGAIALEPPYRASGRISPWQMHVAVHGGLHNGAFVRGLMSPTAPEARRRAAAWIYSQGAPGIYPGDLAFYSEEFDGDATARQIDARSLPVALLSGAYDYSATPSDGARLAELMPGAFHLRMENLGHFPMCEDPATFRPYLMRALSFVIPK